MTQQSKRTVGFGLIGLAGAIALVSFAVFDKIPQDPAYHNFSDTNPLLTIPNALNVLSNLPFLVVGILGILMMLSPNTPLNLVNSNRLAYLVFFIGIASVGIGSGYYHLVPNNETLVWDRLPMTIAFMALFSIIISEYISESVGKTLLIPLLIAGILSVFYWWFTEARGVGDLRCYAVVQFFPLLTIPIILFFFRSNYSPVSAYWLLIASYIAAKLFEHFDAQIHQMLVVISGHSIKHLAPAIGIYILLKSYKNHSSHHE